MRDTPGIVGVAQHVERAQVIVVEQLVELLSGATNTPQHDLARRIRQRRVEGLTRERSGQAAEFNTMTPHWIAGHGAPVEILTIFDRDGEHAHLRAAQPRRATR
jgi:hypothetical protein